MCTLYFGSGVATLAGPPTDADKQRWRFEQRLWSLLPSLLLPSLLLPYANNYLAWATHTLQEPLQQQNAHQYINVQVEYSCNTLAASEQLQNWLDANCSSHMPHHPAWMVEVLGGVLQLADQVRLLELRQQQQQQEVGHQAVRDTHTGSKPTAGNSGTSSSGTSSSSTAGLTTSSTNTSPSTSTGPSRCTDYLALCALNLVQLLSLQSGKGLPLV